ncbi:hypothetical protein C8250_029050 [Streptomyces sp. So13.3]|uniref:hypothetical protein n=1 Tax=Streptomyces sp. So13.3 TaxID=2136173 RepID=UPI00110631FA|nr:hypothetical protein [Streptomyces sp. So13.3]QNA75399.1 hypothetical protein C8250_029050 [Streptomyces sp. So13.3]
MHAVAPKATVGLSDSLHTDLRHAPFSESTTADERLNDLLGYINGLEAQTTHLNARITQEGYVRTIDLGALAGTVENGQKEIEGEIARAVAGSLNLEAWGLVIAALGTAVSAFA